MATGKAVSRGGVKEAMEVIQIDREFVNVAIVGTSPLVCNAMSEKAKQQLLVPPRRKNMAERAATLKHDIVSEFQHSMYAMLDEDEYPTLIGMKSVCFKCALRDVAVDIPGATKAQVGRLTWVEGEYVPIFGIPEFFMTPVRQGDIARTPDIRTRAILPRWAAYVTIAYVRPLVKKNDLVTLFSAAGMINGIGDGRQQKGTHSYGQFMLVDPQDREYLDILRTGGRDAQVKAMANPRNHDEETRRLREWFHEEVARREMVRPVEKASEAGKVVRKPRGGNSKEVRV